MSSLGRETVITDSAGTVISTVTYQPPKDAAHGAFGYFIRALSAGGRYVSFGVRSSDQSRLTGCDFIVDTATEKEIARHRHRHAMSALFLADGRMLIEQWSAAGTMVLSLLSADGTLLDRTTEPEGLGSLLTYVG